MMPPRGARRIVGLLGGSFNPAHEGHIHISIEALRRLGLDEVWWIVSPHNPLKKADELGDYADRLATAAQLVHTYPHIKVSDIERRLGMRYTVDTLRALKRLYPATRFVWLMGADNLTSLHRWRKWDEIMRENPVAVMDRAPHSHHALRSKAAVKYAQFRLKYPLSLRVNTPPGWVFLHLKRDPHSATAIRKRLERRGK